MKNKQYPYYKVTWINNFREFLEYCEKEHGAKVAFEYERNNKLVSKTFTNVNYDAKSLATFFISKNLSREKIAILGENSYEWIISYFAIANSNNIVVPIDKELPIEQVEKILKDTDVSTIIISDEYADYQERISQELSINTVNLKKDFESLLNSGKNIYDANNQTYYDVKLNDDETVAIIYTSGTTGNPKGAMLTASGICKNVVSGMESFEMKGNTVLMLPLNHTYTFSGAVLCVMYSGCKNYINKSLKNLPQDLIKQKPVFLLAVPLMIETFYKRIWKNAKDSKKDTLLKAMIGLSNVLLLIGIDVRRKLFKSVLDAFGGNWNMVICGGAAIDKKYLVGFKNFGVDVLIGYGITECSPFVSVNRNKYYRYGSVGVPLTCSTVKIDKKENETEGEILVKGDMVMQGYYKTPDLTKEVISDGYFKTGDIGYQDKDGFIYITGRKKNVIILSNGKNVYPEELEFELMNNEKIAEVIVKEGKDKKIVAEIFPNKDNINISDAQAVQKYFEDYIVEFNKKQAGYKAINKVEIRTTEFEKTTTKKIKRNY